MKINFQNKFFWLTIIILLLFAAWLLLSPSKSKNLMNVMFDLKSQTNTPFELKGDPDHAIVSQWKVPLEKDTWYIFSGTVTGLPTVYFDFFGKDYDANEQQFEVPGTTTYFEHLLNSYTPPRDDTYFRIFFQDKNNITVDNVVVYGESMKNKIVFYFSFIFFAVAVILLLKLYYGSLFFYFLLISIFAFSVYYPQKYPQWGQGADNKWYIPQVLSMIIENNANLNEYPTRIAEVKDSGVTYVKGSPYINLAYGTTIINYPLTLITRNFFSCDPSLERKKIKCGEQIADLNAKIFASMSVGLLFLVVLLLTNSFIQSGILSFIFAFASPHFTFHAGGLWAHNISVFFILLTLFILLNKKHSYMSSIPLALSYITRPTMSVSVIFLSIFYFIKERKNFTKYLSLGLFIALVFFIYNYITYLKFFPPYYAGGRLFFDSFIDAALGLLFSPNRGLFVFFPIAFFSVIGMYYSFKKNSNPFFKVISLMLMAHFVVNATFPHWWGGPVYGPRPYAEFIPYFILLLIPAWNIIQQKKWLQIIFTIFILWSTFVQFRGLTSYAAYNDWGFTPISVDFASDRIWDWKDMQIFRGFPN